MEKDIHAIRAKYQDCESQLSRCEEVLKDLTEKLAEKQKEVCFLTLMFFKLEEFVFKHLIAVDRCSKAFINEFCFKIRF